MEAVSNVIEHIEKEEEHKKAVVVKHENGAGGLKELRGHINKYKGAVYF